jgi:hypothetical protein
MTKVFIGGSRHASRLNADVLRRLDNIIDKGIPIIIGDANGADKSVQQYLHSKHYENVEVFCSEGVCRNNVGGWRTRSIPAPSQSRGAEFYSAKDRAMANEATIGLMVWDGRSLGTLLNVVRLLWLRKKAVIYAVPERQFREFRSLGEWESFLAGRGRDLRRKLEERTRLEGAVAEPVQTSFLE